MKNLQNLGKVLNKQEQQSISGGLNLSPIACQVGCGGRTSGRCYGSPNCQCPGRCGSGGNCNIF